MIDSAIVAALVAGAVSGIVSLAGIWYQGRRAARDDESRLIVARIAETRRFMSAWLMWLSIAKNRAGVHEA